jgi:hypothetical protein
VEGSNCDPSAHGVSEKLGNHPAASANPEGRPEQQTCETCCSPPEATSTPNSQQRADTLVTERGPRATSAPQSALHAALHAVAFLLAASSCRRSSCRRSLPSRRHSPSGHRANTKCGCGGGSN